MAIDLSKFNINGVNQIRSYGGLPPKNYVWCKLCCSVNEHFWWNCKLLVCKICKKNHATFTCPYAYACQWCGSTTHISQVCDDTEGRTLKAGCHRRCYRCGRLGHIACQCTASSRNFGKPRRRRRRKRRRRIRRY